jgi:hypothetical protein
MPHLVGLDSRSAVMECHGAGPFQNHIPPPNFRFIRSAAAASRNLLADLIAKASSLARSLGRFIPSAGPR